ncbi:MAG: homocysteine S-methyltransferase family protein, partial [Pseudomonadota bacterium]
NTFASSRLMLGPAGLGDQFKDINRIAVEAAHRARDASGRDDVLIAGSVSHMCPMVGGTARPDPDRVPPEAEMADAFEELGVLLRDEGCDLILLEMMYDPARIGPAFRAATATGLPVWAGFSARRGQDGQVLSFAPGGDIPFSDLLRRLDDFDVQAAGVMHTPANLVGDALDIVRGAFRGPLMAYPDSGYFKMPDWQFDDAIPPAELLRFATRWIEGGAQVVGGCCGLSPQHISALAPLRDRRGAT